MQTEPQKNKVEKISNILNKYDNKVSVVGERGVARTLGNAGNYKKAEDADREKKVVNFA